jgi:hypothetical protein
LEDANGRYQIFKPAELESVGTAETQGETHD